MHSYNSANRSEQIDKIESTGHDRKSFCQQSFARLDLITKDTRQTGGLSSEPQILVGAKMMLSSDMNVSKILVNEAEVYRRDNAVIFIRV